MLFRQLLDHVLRVGSLALKVLDTLQNGDAGQLYDTITGVLFALPDATLVFPAHDYRGRTVTTIAEEKRWNIRVAGRSREAFIEHMGSLHLPPPRRFDEAVTANRACGNVPIPVQG